MRRVSCLAAVVVLAATVAASLRGDSPVAALTTGAVTPASAEENRQMIDAALRDGGTCTLPAGVVVVDRPPTLTSRSTLAGDPAGSTLITAGWAPTIGTSAPGLGYAEVGHISGPMQVGEWCYRYLFDWQHTGQPKPLLCQVVKVAGQNYQTNPPPDPRHNAILRFRKAWPCGQPQEGDSSVTLATVPAAGLSAGMAVYVTDGPSVADAARGEHRRIVSVSGNLARLDRPLRMSYGPAVLAWIEPIEGVTVRGLKIDAPSNGNSVTWAAMWKGCTGLRIERCTFTGAADVVTCGDVLVSECTGPALQLNTAYGVRVDRCRFGALYCEEATGDVDVIDCEFGPGRDPAANCVAGYYACERLRFRNVRVVGAGRQQWPPPSAWNVHGRECLFTDIEVTASRGGWTVLGGDNLVIRGFRTDGGFQIPKASRASLSQIRGPYVELVDGTTGVAVDVSRIKAGAGWQQVACEAWAAQGQALHAPSPRKVPPAGQHWADFAFRAKRRP